MTGYDSKVSQDDYQIQFYTDRPDLYDYVQDACRRVINLLDIEREEQQEKEDVDC